MQNQHRVDLFFFCTLTLLLLPAAAAAGGFLVGGFRRGAAKVNNFGLLLVQKQALPSSFDEDNHVPASFNVDEVRRQLESLFSRTLAGEDDEHEPPAAPPAPSPPPVLQLKKPATIWFHPSFPPPASTTPEPAPAVGATVDEEIDLLEETLPPITTMDRKCRLAELELLRDLVNGNEAVPVLQDLWVHERGEAAASRLLQADALASQPETWPEAEAVLLQLIAIHGVHWAEPVNRLATLYFIQGRLRESEKFCLKVLQVKPWHFGALSGLVLLYSKLQNLDLAYYWAELRLPPLSPMLGPQPRRNEWVKRSARQARDALAQAEKRLQDEFFGPRDKKRNKKQTSPRHNLTQVNDGDRVDDCWQ